MAVKREWLGPWRLVEAMSWDCEPDTREPYSHKMWTRNYRHPHYGIDVKFGPCISDCGVQHEGPCIWTWSIGLGDRCLLKSITENV